MGGVFYSVRSRIGKYVNCVYVWWWLVFLKGTGYSVQSILYAIYHMYARLSAWYMVCSVAVE